MKNQSKSIKIAMISAFAVFVLIMGITITKGAVESYDKQKELAAKEAESEQWDIKNDELEAYFSAENESALYENYAHKAGYVYPDERVYIQGR